MLPQPRPPRALPLALLLLLLAPVVVQPFFLPPVAVQPSTTAARRALGASADGASSSKETPHPRKMDKRWQKRRKRVELGPDGLPIAPVHAPRQMRSSKCVRKRPHPH
jgi:hypothetical protein